MNLRLHSLFPRRLFSLSVLLTLISCLAGFATVLPAQTAHFSGAVQTLGSGFDAPRGVAVGAGGNVFVADSVHSAVKEIVAAGGYATINTLGSGFTGPNGVAVDGSGNVFVADTWNNAVKEILAAGGYTTVNTLGSGFNHPEGVAVDRNGNVFVADTWNNAVKEIVAIGGYTTVNTLGSGFSAPAAVAVGAAGNVFVADSGHNAVKEILAGGYTTVNTLGSRFSSPAGVAVDGSGNVFVGDTSNGEVKEIVAAGGYTTIKTLRSGFQDPMGVAVDASGNVFVADTGHSAVKEIMTASGNFGSVNVGGSSANPVTLVFTFDTGGTLGSTAVLTRGATGLDFTDAGTGTCKANTAYNAGDICTVNVTFKPRFPGARYGAAELLDTSGNLLAMGYVQGTGVGPQVTFANSTTGDYLPSAQINLGSGFDWVAGVAVDGNGNVFLTDQGHSEVKEILAVNGSIPASPTIKTLGSGFSSPCSVAVDGAGNVFVADTYHSKIKEIVAAGGYTSINTLGSGFNQPNGLTVDGSGNVFVADWNNDAVYEIVAEGGYTTVKNLVPGSFVVPDDVAVDGAGNVYVTDWGHSAVKEILAAGGYTTVKTVISGLPEYGFLAIDASGNIFISGWGDGTLKEFVAADAFTTSKTLARGLYEPGLVALDGRGHVFVADAGHNVIVWLDYADPPSLTFAKTTVGVESNDSPQTVTVSNNGNAALKFPLPYTGNNPSISTNFRWDSSSTCDQTSASSSTAFSLAEGATCSIAIDFAPTTVGSIAGSVVLTDNALNVRGATQTVSLTGTTVEPTPTVTLTSSLNPSTVGAAVTFTATVTGSGPMPVAPVSFLDGTTTLATMTPSGGVAKYTTNALTGGTHSITASYAGGANYSPAHSSVLTQTVNNNNNKPTPTVTLTSSLNPSTVGASVTFTATVTGSGPIPTAAVSFLDGATTLATVTPSGSVAKYTTTALTAGKHWITASYAGDANYNPAQSSVLTQTVVQTTPTVTLTSSLNPSTVGASVTFTATVTGYGPIPTAAVSFLDGTTTLATVMPSGGVAKYTTTALTAGTHSITASFVGGANYNAATSSVLTQTVN